MNTPMSENGEELELQALERKLDDAFATTRPRAGFEDELWSRMQSHRPAPRRFRDALSGFWSGVREVPAVPATATALVLIVAVGVGVFTLGGLGRGAGGATSLSGREAAPNASQYTAGSFGKVPTPALSNATKAPTPETLAPNGADFAGPVRLQWTGSFDVNVTTAPVFRYREPTMTDSDQFASALGAVLRGRPSGSLGMYAGVDYSLSVRGTLASTQPSPPYFIFSGLNVAASDTVGGPQAAADVFLAQHSLTPQWQYTVAVDGSNDPIKVIYERQFEVPGLGPAYLVDFSGNHYGLEVDLTSNRVVFAAGILPVGLDVASYSLTGSADAIAAATASSPAPASPAVPVVQLNHVEVVYVLVSAGDHSFYEPAYMFSGSFQSGGQSYTKHVLIPAVDPKQRS